MDNAKRIWELLDKEGFTDYGKAGVLANIRAESAIRSDNAQDSGNRRLGMTDAQYTTGVDNGTYKNFIKDSIGYGLCQWTYWSRKKALREFRSYGIYDELKNSKSVADATRCMMIKFERPANQSEANVQARANYGHSFYAQYAKPAVSKSTLDDDLAKLVKAKIISTPEYWKKTAPTVKYLPDLIHNMAEAL